MKIVDWLFDLRGPRDEAKWRCVPRVQELEGRNLLSYTIADLETLGGDTSSANGINAFEQVVGSSTTRDGHTHAFLYSSGQMTDLGTISSATGDSHGTGINVHGDVTGDSINSAGYVHAFRRLSSDGIMRDLGIIAQPPKVGNSYGTAINDNADVTGKSEGGQAADDAFWYQNSSSTMYDLETQNAYSFGNALNNASTPIVVGGQDNFY